MDLEDSQQWIEEQWNIQPETIEVIDEQQGLWFVKRASGRPLLARGHYSFPVEEQDMDTITAWWIAKKKEAETSSSIVHYVTPRENDKIQRLVSLIMACGGAVVEVGASETVAVWRHKDDEKRFQAAYKKEPIEPVKLYEDSAGNLFLYQHGTSLVYQTDPYLNPRTTFEDECRAIVQGDTQDWSEDWIHPYIDMMDVFNHPETHLIATWYPDKPYALHQQPGEAGRRYLQLPTEE